MYLAQKIVAVYTKQFVCIKIKENGENVQQKFQMIKLSGQKFIMGDEMLAGWSFGNRLISGLLQLAQSTGMTLRMCFNLIPSLIMAWV